MAGELDELGREVPDPRPVEWPLGLKAPLSIQDEIKRYVRAELSQAAGGAGFETFEEADDFDVDDEELLTSPYELQEMQEERPLVAKQEAPQAPAEQNGTQTDVDKSTTKGEDLSGGGAAGDKPPAQ